MLFDKSDDRDGFPAHLGLVFVGANLHDFAVFGALDNLVVVEGIFLVGDSIINPIVIARFIEAKATISCNDKQCVRTSVLYAQFKNKCFEVTMDITGDNYLSSVRILKK